MRALEVAALTGAGISVRQTQWNGFHGTDPDDAPVPSRHPFVMIRLVRGREDIRERIRTRADRMVAAGLRKEAEWVFANRERLSRTLLQAVGYKELFPFFQGKSSWEEALDRLCLASHRLVRKQETWFRKFPAGEVFLYPDTDFDRLAGELNRTAFRPA